MESRPRQLLALGSYHPPNKPTLCLLFTAMAEWCTEGFRELHANENFIHGAGLWQYKVFDSWRDVPDPFLIQLESALDLAAPVCRVQFFDLDGVPNSMIFDFRTLRVLNYNKRVYYPLRRVELRMPFII